ncbi:hypothetical protein X975_04174, partial [Stegodyphus mimosarum]
MSFRDLLSDSLNSLVANNDSKTAREAIETLLKIHRNILYNEYETSYRRIKQGNPAFLKKVWSLKPGRRFMILCGWIEVEDLVVFNSDEKLIDIIETLVEHRSLVPSYSEWEESTKYEGKSEDQLREERLREKAAKERQKELEEFMKDKKYKENLAQSIKAKIAEDNMRRKQVFTHPVVEITTSRLL